MSEKNEINKALEGDEDAFERLLLPYRSLILNLAYRISGNKEDAKEISQEAIIKIYKYLKTFKINKSFKNWICKITINASYDFNKKQKNIDYMIHEKAYEIMSGKQNNPECMYLNTEIGKKIQNCLSVLTPAEKSVFLLRDNEGFSINETAEILGYPGSSVRTHLCRARQKIRFKLKKYFGDSGGRESA